MTVEPRFGGEKAPSPLRILVVDDDSLVLKMFGWMLKQHVATLVSSGDEALALIRCGHSFDAILCDLHMPGMNGESFYRVLLEDGSDLTDRIVFMAGGAYSGHDEAFLAMHPTLMKPFRLTELEDVIASLGAVPRLPAASGRLSDEMPATRGV